MIDRLDPEVERIFREALGHAARAEMAELAKVQNDASVAQLAACLSLCGLVTAYVAIDVFDRNWPDSAALARIAKHTATSGELVKRTGLTMEDAYEYISRAALRGEALDKVFPDPDKLVTVPFLVASSILPGYRPQGKHWWEWLDAIEDALEKAWTTDLGVLPALMVRTRFEAAMAARQQADAHE
jgi:hypothetical protein